MTAQSNGMVTKIYAMKACAIFSGCLQNASFTGDWLSEDAGALLAFLGPQQRPVALRMRGGKRGWKK